MVIPIEDSFLYVEPVFLIADGVDMPQLQRVIVTNGEQVVMEPTLDRALEALFGRAPQTPVVAQPLATDTTGAAPSEMVSIPSPQLQRVQQLWDEAQQALQDGDWQLFGERMDQVRDQLNTE